LNKISKKYKEIIMKKMVLIFAISFIALFISGCGGSKVLNLPKQAVEREMGQDDVYNAILKAGNRKGWYIKQLSDGQAKGELFVRKHEAVIIIDYTATSYSVTYQSSKNLNYDASSGKIHPGYNKWILGLKQQIDIELKRLNLQESSQNVSQAKAKINQKVKVEEDAKAEEFIPVKSW